MHTSSEEEIERKGKPEEIPRKFKCIIEEPECHYVPFSRTASESPPERLVIHCGMSSSLPQKLKLGIRPERPSGFVMSPTTWHDAARRSCNHQRTWRGHASSTSRTTSSTSAVAVESNEFVLMLGGIACANISTTGSGEGLIRGLNSPSKPHAFCRCTILAIPAEATILRIVQIASNWFELLRSLIRMGFLLLPKHMERPVIHSAWTMWDMFDLQKCGRSLKLVAPNMWRKAEGDGSKLPEPWPITYPLCGGKHLPVMSLRQRRQRCFVHSFRFTKVTGHEPRSKFMTLEQNRSIVLLFENRPISRCLGNVMDQKNGLYKTIGNDCASEALFQHPCVSMVEWTNTSMAKVRDHGNKYRSPVMLSFANKKSATVSSFLSHLRYIGVKLRASLPKYTENLRQEKEKK